MLDCLLLLIAVRRYFTTWDVEYMNSIYCIESRCRNNQPQLGGKVMSDQGFWRQNGPTKETDVELKLTYHVGSVASSWRFTIYGSITLLNDGPPGIKHVLFS